jgi:ABC-type dipeptide/oligopeptide/nickel transport system ATPase component
MAKERTNQNRQTKKISLLVKDPRYNLRPLATITKEVLHVHGGHNGSRDGSEVTDQLCPLLLPDVLQEPGLDPAKVLADA